MAHTEKAPRYLLEKHSIEGVDLFPSAKTASDRFEGNSIGALFSQLNCGESIVFCFTGLACASVAEEAISRYGQKAVLHGRLGGYSLIRIEDMPLQVRTKNALGKANVLTVEDLLSLGSEKVSKFRGVGTRVIQDIESCLGDISQDLLIAYRGTSSLTPSQKNSAFPNSEITLSRTIALDTSELTTRAKRILAFNRIDTINQVLELGYERIKNFRNAGELTARQIMEQAIAQAKASQEPHNDDLREEAAHQTPQDDEGSTFDIVRLREFLLCAGDNVVLPITAVLYENNFSDEGAALWRKATVACAIQKALEENPWGLSTNELVSQVRRRLPSATREEATQCAMSLLAEGCVAQSGETWLEATIQLEDYIHQAVPSKRTVQMLTMRWNGLPLGEIASHFDLTRQRVEQILGKQRARVSLSGTRAYRYRAILDEYSFGADALCNLMEATSLEWGAIAWAANAKRQETTEESICRFIRDERFIERIRLRVADLLNKGKILVEGEYVKASRKEILMHLLKKHASSNAITDEELTALYREAIESSGANDPGLLQPLERYLSNFRGFPEVLSGYRGRIRYFDYHKCDIDSLIEKICFSDYQDKEISTRILLRNYANLLSEHELFDPYELHSLLRHHQEITEKAGGATPYRVGRRMPMLKVGDVNRENQVIELAKALSPISVSDFTLAYEEEYGVDAATVYGNYLSPLYEFVNGGIITMGLPSLLESEMSIMDDLLTEDFYELDQVRSIYLKSCNAGSLERLNPRSLRELGYKVYSHTILRNTWQGLNEFFNSYIFREQFFDEGCVPNHVKRTREYSIYLDELLRNRRILPLESGKWITEEGLAWLDIGHDLLDSFIEEAAIYCENRNHRYCNTEMLLHNGFYHELLDEIDGGLFFDALLCTKGTRFTALRIGGAIVCCLDDAPARLSDFIDSQIPEGLSVEVDGLLDGISTQFGANLDRWRTVASCNGTSLYHSSVTDKIYKDYDVFLKAKEG